MKLSYSKLLILWVLALSLLVPKIWAEYHDIDVYLDDGVWIIADGSGTVLASDGNWDFVDAVNASFTYLTDDRATRHQTYGICEVSAGTDSNTYANNDLTDAGTVADISLVGANSVSDGNTLSPELDTWFGWAVDGQQRVDSGPMGRFYVGNSPWVYSYSLGRYLYINENFAASGGAWFFMPMFGQQ